MDLQKLNETAKALVADGKGILAADESSGTIKKRFDSIGVESTEENRRDYREFLFRAEGSENFISGVILFDETLRQDAADGTPLREVLSSKGIIPGIKVDTGREAAGALRGRDGHRGPRRAARAAGRVRRAGRALRQVAGDLLDRRRASVRVLRVDERARARALRGAVPGGGHRPDRRAGGAPGRDAHDRGELEGDRPRARRRSSRSCTTSASSSRDAAQAEHGALGLRGFVAGRRRGGRAGDDGVLLPPRPGRRCRGSCSSPAARPTRTRPRT